MMGQDNDDRAYRRGLKLSVKLGHDLESLKLNGAWLAVREQLEVKMRNDGARALRHAAEGEWNAAQTAAAYHFAIDLLFKYMDRIEATAVDAVEEMSEMPEDDDE